MRAGLASADCKKALQLTLVGVILVFSLALVSKLTAYESIDEYAIDFWSSRVANNPFSPVKALSLEPEADRKFGFLGFIPSGHFVYNRALEEIFRGERYSITPMVHYVALYGYGVFKCVFGNWIFYFCHALFCLAPCLFFIGHAYRKRDGPGMGLGLVFLFSPAFTAFASYASAESVGGLGMAVFCFLWLRCQKTATLNAPSLFGLVFSSLVLVFYKPIGIVFFPWVVFAVAILPGRLRVRKTVFILSFFAAGFVVIFLAEKIYHSALWAGYQRPISKMLFGANAGVLENFSFDAARKVEDPLGTGALFLENKVGSWSWGLLHLGKMFASLFVVYPILVFLPFGIWAQLKAVLGKGDRDFGEGLCQFAMDLLFIYPVLLYFAVFCFYPQSDAFNLAAPVFRYFFVPVSACLWYFCDPDPRLVRPRMVYSLLGASALITLTMPGNILSRIGLRYYLAVAQTEITSSLPQNSVLVGGNYYDKLVVSTGVPIYSFFSTRTFGLSEARAHYRDTDARYEALLGRLSDIPSRLIAVGYIPILIFPDYRILDGPMIEDTYSHWRYAIIRKIEVPAKMGWVGRLVPKDRRYITIAKLSAEQIALP